MTLPTGPAVTFFFSDVEGSTRLAQELGADAWEVLLSEHDRLVDAAVEQAGGVLVKHEGDGVFAAFEDPTEAVMAAVAFARALSALGDHEAPQRARVRIGLHTGEGRVTTSGTDYVGIDVHYAARVAAAGNGGQILISDSTQAGIGAAPQGTQVVDAGERRLKDFEIPRVLYRLVVPGAADDERPLRTIDAPTNLPTPATNFVGREDELDALATALAETRLLTLTGPGGTGKTRLGLRLAVAAADRFPGGTWFVDLAPLRDPALIPATVAAALGIAEEPGTPIRRTLEAALKPLDSLLVLDNLEQLLPQAATDVAELLLSCPKLRVLVTSRERLRITGEREYTVPPLDAESGVKLFLDRARLVRPDVATTDAELAAVGAIVTRLEGLPLAIELAAARTRMFAPTAVLERLTSSLELLAGGARDLPERQRTLRGAIAWSHDLLSPDEQAIFRRCSVFHDSWDGERAQQVVDPNGRLEMIVVDGLESLSDKSFVRIEPSDHGEPRFRRHTLLSEFALDRLDESGERAECERRHAMAYLEVAEVAGPNLGGADTPTWVDRLGYEKANMRAAMRWSLAVDEPAVGLRILSATWRYWQLTSQFAEGAMWARELLAHPLATNDIQVRIGALAAQGGIAYWANDFATTRAAYTERLDLAEELGDELALAEAHYELGFVGVIENDVDFLQTHETIALEIFERLGVHNGVVRARQATVLAHFLRGEYREARDLEVVNLTQFEKAGARLRMSDSLMLLAVASIFIDDLVAAGDFLTRSRRLTSGVVTDELAGLVVCSHYALRAGRVEDAARLAGAAETLTEETGVTNAALNILHLPDPAVLVRERLGERADAYLDEGRAMSSEDAVLLARTLTEPSTTPVSAG